MRVLAFGSLNDKQAWDVVDKIKSDLPDIEFIKTSSVDDIFAVKDDLVIMDAVKGIEKPCLLGINDLKELRLNTLHDFDIGFFLKLMKFLPTAKQQDCVPGIQGLGGNIIKLAGPLTADYHRHHLIGFTETNFFQGLAGQL